MTTSGVPQVSGVCKKALRGRVNLNLIFVDPQRGSGSKIPGNGSSTKAAAKSPFHPPTSLQCKESPCARTHNQPSSSRSPQRPIKGSSPRYYSDPPQPAERPALEKTLTEAEAPITRRSAPCWPRPFPGAGPGRVGSKSPPLFQAGIRPLGSQP